jgi:hypothetical protein
MARSKYITHFCAYCHKETKMEAVGGKTVEVNGSESLRIWFRCQRCKHSALIDRSVPTSKLSIEDLSKDGATEYAATKVFTIGEAIYHSEWDDLGRVISKNRTSGGVQAITVSFQKLGERKLVENLQADALGDTAQI